MIAPNTAIKAVEYPDSDGKRMAENTQQYRWIVMIQGSLDNYYRDDPNVFVAGDNLIYTVEGNPKIRRAPDVYVAFGRPKGDRGSYKVWEENNIFPQVLFEVISPKNTLEEMRKKKAFYLRYGAEEYYIINPQRKVPSVEIYLREKDRFKLQKPKGFVSPRLGIRFQPTRTDLLVFLPSGEPFQTFVQMGARADQEAQRAKQETHRADLEAQRAESAMKRSVEVEAQFQAAVAHRKALEDKLRELGVDPDSLKPT